MVFLYKKFSQRRVLSQATDRQYILLPVFVFGTNSVPEVDVPAAVDLLRLLARISRQPGVHQALVGSQSLPTIEICVVGKLMRSVVT